MTESMVNNEVRQYMRPEAFEAMVFYATRYCLGRQTYAVGECVQYLLDNWHTFSRGLRDGIIEDVRRELASARGGGMAMDRKEWRKVFLAELKLASEERQ